MSVDYADFLDFAEKTQHGEAEIDWRMCAARAYYAAYHRANLSVISCPDVSNVGIGSHERVTERLKAFRGLKGKSLAYVLIGLKKFRKLADYELDDDFEQAVAFNQISIAKEFMSKADEFDSLAQEKSA